MIHEKPYEHDSKEDIQRVFNEVDQELKGYLNADDLRSMAAELKEELTEPEIKMVFEKLDPKKTGKISFEAFMEFHLQKVY
jgi:Ca2+-binding EF-hand superfamily protein